MNVLNQIRESCAMVASQAHYVHINTHELSAYAASLPIDRIAAPEQDPAHHYLGHGAATVAYFLTLGAVNFGSGYFPHLVKPDGLSGYFTIAGCLKRRFEEQGPLRAGDLADVTPRDCAKLFRQEPDGGPRS